VYAPRCAINGIIMMLFTGVDYVWASASDIITACFCLTSVTDSTFLRSFYTLPYDLDELATQGSQGCISMYVSSVEP